MRKFIATGVAALSTLTFTVGAAGAAKADIVPPAGVIAQVCNALPAPLTSLAGALTTNGSLLTSLLGAGPTSLSTKQADLTTALNDFVAAVVTHVQTINNGGNVAASGQTVAAKASVYGDKFTAWNTAFNALKSAEFNSTMLGIQSGVLNGHNSGLGCTPAP
jgi:hypothetical protein